MSAAELKEIYDQDFFSGHAEGAEEAAALVVPLVVEMLPGLASVVDIGCGAGHWLAAFARAGVGDTLGLDGGETAAALAIAPAQFRETDLARPIRLARRFDLAVSLEVAEHLPAARGESFVADLCALADIVLFSAAIPGQDGTHHINERWPSYWAGLFAAHGYTPHDVIRPRIWTDRRIPFWYRQNVFLYANPAGRARLSLPAGAGWPRDQASDLAHPDLYYFHTDELLARRRAETPATRYLMRLERQLGATENRLAAMTIEHKAARYDVYLRECQLAEQEAEIAALKGQLAAVNALIAGGFAAARARSLSARLVALAGSRAEALARRYLRLARGE
jgi:SAM-dependent methyltransferase